MKEIVVVALLVLAARQLYSAEFKCENGEIKFKSRSISISLHHEKCDVN